MKRLRILQLITSMAGGAGVHVYQLAKHLDPNRFEIVVAYGPGYPLDAKLVAERINRVELRWPRSLHWRETPRGMLDVCRLLRTIPFDIVHTHCSLAAAVGRPLASLLHQGPVLFTLHAWTDLPHHGPVKRSLLQGLERGMSCFTDHYCVSTRLYEQKILERRLASPDRISQIALGIDIPEGCDGTEQRQRQSTRKSLGLGEEERVVMFSGRLEPQKGVDHLIEAWPRVLAQFRGARLVILGDGPLRHQLERQAEHLGIGEQVLFAGWRDDAAQLLAAADVFCLPSRWEAFGYVLLEAMAAGVPIVASAVDGIPEVLRNGELGLLFPCGDNMALAERLSRLLGDPLLGRELSRRAALSVRIQHDVRRMTQEYSELYFRLVAARVSR